MSNYTIKRTHVIPATLAAAWNFFSSPENLSRLTPARMNLRIVHRSGEGKMFPGLVLKYKVSILPWLTTNWESEITHVQEPYCFIDEQRDGPFAKWRHEHHFKEIPEGVEMTDIVNYEVPVGILGKLANLIFVERQVNAIFDYRSRAVDNYFLKDHKT